MRYVIMLMLGLSLSGCQSCEAPSYHRDATIPTTVDAGCDVVIDSGYHRCNEFYEQDFNDVIFNDDISNDMNEFIEYAC